MGDWFHLISAVQLPTLLAIDLDDTLLLPDGSLSPRSVHAMGRLRRRPIAVIPVTARRPSDVTGLFRGSGAGPLAVVSNGATIWDLHRNELVAEQPLPIAVVATIIQSVRRAFPEIVLGVEYLNDLVCEPALIEVLSPSGEYGYRLTSDLSTVINQPFSKVICWHPAVGAAPLTVEIQQVVGETASAVTTGGRWVELLHPRANKGAALLQVCSLLSIPPEQVISVGNDANDLPMMRVAGISLAVANATSEVLRVADGVLPANAEDGVAIMLEALDGLIEARVDDERTT